MWEKFKAWLKKVQTWWLNSKLRVIWQKVGKAVRQFLRWSYAAQISYLVLAVIFFLWVSGFVGYLLIVWGIVLLIAEIRQKIAEKKQLNPQPEPPVPVEPVVPDVPVEPEPPVTVAKPRLRSGVAKKKV